MQAKFEMMMMEKESVPIETKDEEGDGYNADPKNRALDMTDVKGMKGGEKGGEEVVGLYPSFLRPSVFSYINIDCTSPKPRSSERVPLKYTQFFTIPKAMYSRPDPIFQACLPLYLPLDRLVSVLGLPQNTELREDSDVSGVEYEWYVKLSTDGDSEGESDGDEDSSDMYLYIRSIPQSAEYLSALVSSTLIQPSLFTSKDWGVLEEGSSIGNIALFEMYHHAAMSEQVISLLERQLLGFFFMCHYDFPAVFLDEDDSDILMLGRQLCKHPMCRAISDSEPKRSYVDERGDRVSDTSEDQGGSTMIAIDVYSILRSIVSVSGGEELLTEAQVEEVVRRVRPLDDRLRVFVSDTDTIFTLEYEIKQLLAQFRSLEDLESDQDSVHWERKVQVEDEHWEKLNSQYRDSSVCIVDLGNACWTHKHFTDDIQTRQYRAPEVLLSAEYDCPADMWSLGCIVFELLTGDLMFDPHSGKSWNREEDHLALIIELLGEFPKSLIAEGKKSGDFFTRQGELKHISNLNFWGLKDVLHDKYKFREEDAEEIADFLHSILRVSCKILMLCLCMHIYVT
ncbi:hypothetical protein EON65_46220 [archaeon]|nr:MAG: hypothetical protein EON65_46220 [archaeon]